MASRQVPINSLVTVDDIAKRYHMSVGQVSNIVCGRNGKKSDEFPQPVVGERTRAVWLVEDVEQWFRTTLPNQDLAERRDAKKRKKARYVNQPMTA